MARARYCEVMIFDRRGATLDLPMVTRWSAYGVDMLDN
jgi:hypothetical protein